MARGEPPRRTGSQLPAPYRSPWSGLGESLAAVLADRRLALQRLWRRNRDGELPRPQLWPASLAALFWPLLLSAGLALLLGLGGWLLNLAGSGPPPSPAGTNAPQAGAAPVAPPPRPASDAPAPEAMAGQAAAAAREPIRGQSPDADLPRAAAGEAERERQRPQPDRDATGPSRATPGESPEAPLLRLDPLLELLSQGEEAELLLAARPDPANARLSLSLSPAAEALPQAALLEQAQRWQQRARAAGYERLELRDHQGRLRGRDALVGSGMILLAPIPGS